MEQQRDVQLRQVYVLHRRAYRETSLMLDFFCESLGKFRGILRGAQGKKNSTSGHLQPFIPLSIFLRGDGDLKTIKQVEVEQALTITPLKSKALYSGLYVNELLYYLLETQLALPELFTVYQQTLINLASAQDLETTLRRFELQLLNSLGYGFEFEFDAETGIATEPEHYYQLRSEQGIVKVSQEYAQKYKHCYQGQQLLDLAAGNFSDKKSQIAAKRIMRSIIQQLLGGRPLKSRELFLTV